MMAMETQLGLGTMYGILTNTCVNPNYIKIIDKVIQSPVTVLMNLLKLK